MKLFQSVAAFTKVKFGPWHLILRKS